MSPSEWAKLAGKAQNGDQKALEDLLAQSAPMIYYTALKMTGNVQDAEDLSQESYVKLLEELPKLRDIQAAAKWIKLIVVNLCKNHMKKKRPFLFQSDEEESAALGGLTEEETTALPDAYMDMAAKRQIITGMINALPDKQKVTVYLYYYDELTVEQIAQLMEISEGTVKSRLSAARRTLQANVEEERWGNYTYDFQVTCDSGDTIASVIVTSGPSFLGLGYGDSQDTAQAALTALGNEDGVSSTAYGQQVTLSSANAERTLIYHVGCMDGTVTSVSVEVLGTP